MLNLDCYGIHIMEGDIALLVQGEGVQHVLGVDFPLQVNVPPKLFCTHHVMLNMAKDDPMLLKYKDDLLFQMMLPLPKKEFDLPVFVEDTIQNRKIIYKLQGLCSPDRTATMIPIWMFQSSMLRETNIQPLILFGATPKRLNKILDEAAFSPRKVIIMAPRNTVTGGRGQWTTTTLLESDFDNVDLPRAGAFAAQQFMLGKHHD